MRIVISPVATLVSALVTAGSYHRSHAFQLAQNTRPAICLQSHELLHTTQWGDDDSDDEQPITTTAVMSRRTAMTSSLAMAASFLAVATTAPGSSHAAMIGGATQSARIASWPGIENIEPLYEFKLSVDAVVAGVEDPKNWPAIEKRLERFFKGFVINEKNFYLGVAFQYSNDIQYDKEELPSYVLMDKEARFDAIDLTMKSLESLKKSLAAGDAAAIADNAKTAQNALGSWFALVPSSDMEAVKNLYTSAMKADSNRDGRLSDAELVFLSPREQELWKRTVDKFG